FTGEFLSQKNQKCSRDVILVRCIEKADGGIFFLDEAQLRAGNTQYGSSRDAGFGDLKFTKQIEKADNTSSGKVSDIEAAYYKHGGNVAAVQRNSPKKEPATQGAK
ncbi:MAG: hypothetical protein GY847_32880, partial [Proteobacteria bacterium]|nr:hypothetical protein [Pseudomonadota bacterium]